jgi:2-haloacid dehalogenase
VSNSSSLTTGSFKGIKCLTFDIIGTVFDVYGSLSVSLKPLAKQYSLKIDAKAYASGWVSGYANGVAAVNSGAKPWTAPDKLLQNAFAAMLAHDGLPAPSAQELNDFLNLWRRLDPWPEVLEAMQKLHQRFKLVVLSNMSIATQTALKEHSGLPFDATLSAETVGKYKQEEDPAVYQYAMSALGLSASEIMMVAAHKYDLRGAKSVGFRTAFVARPLERGPSVSVDTTPDPSFDINATSFEDLARQLTAAEFAFDLWRSNWTKGWSSIVSFANVNHVPHFLSYKGDDGTVAIDRVKTDGKGTDELWRSKWTRDWSSIVPLVLGGKPHLLCYKKDDGTVAIDRMQDDCKGTNELWRSDWTKGWSSIVPFVLNGHYHLLSYKIGDGMVAIDRIKSDGKGTDELWRSDWSKGWTSIVPFDLGGKQHLLSYKSGDGTVAIDRVKSDGKGTDELWRSRWSKGWSSMVAVVVGGKPHLLSYKIDDFTAAIDRVNANGGGTTELQRASWTKGWTSIVPFMLSSESKSHILIYKRDEGTVAIDRFKLGAL